MDQKDFINETKKILANYEKTKPGVKTKTLTQSLFEGFEITQDGRTTTMPLGEFLYELFLYVAEDEENYRNEIKQLKHDIKQLEAEIDIRKEIRKDLEVKIKKLNQPRMIRQMVVRSYQSISEDGINGNELLRLLKDGWKVVCNNYVPPYETSRVTAPAYIEYILEKEIEDEQQTESEAL